MEISQCVKEFGPRDTIVASLLVNLGVIQEFMHQDNQSDSAFRECLAIRELTFGGDHPETWNARYSWAYGLSSREKDVQTLQILEAPLLSYRHGKLVDHGAIASCLALAACAYYSQGHFMEAEECFRLSISGISRSGYQRCYKHSLCIFNYCWLLIDIGKAQEAEAILNTAIRDFNSKEAEVHDLPRYYCILGEALQSMGRLLEAEKAYLTSKKLFLILLNGFDDETVLANLGVLYIAMHRYDDAERFLKQCLAIMAPISSEVGRQLGNLAGVYQAQGRFREAEEACRKALDIQRKRYGDEHYLVSRTLHRLGMLLYRQRRYDEADSLLEAAWRMGVRTLSPGDDRMGRYSMWWGKSSLKLGHTDRADSLIHMAMDFQLNYLHRNWTSLTEKEQSQFYGMLKSSLEYYFTYVHERYAAAPQLAGDLYNVTLAGKAIMQQSARLVQVHIQRSGDTALLRKFAEWSALKGRLAFLAGKRKGQDSSVELDSIALYANALEKELITSSQVFAAAMNTRSISWQDVKSALGKGEAAVEIVRYRESDSTDSERIWYGVLILRGDRAGPPILITLSPGDSLEHNWLVDYKMLLTPADASGEDAYRRTQQRAWDRYWAPIAQHLSGIRRVFLAADGVYHLINPDILSRDGRAVLIDELELRRMTSTRSLLERKSGPVAARHAVLVGAPDFGGDYAAYTSYTGQRDKTDVFWSPLRASGKEVAETDRLLRKNGWKSDIFLGSDARKSALIRVKSPGLLHVSSHAFFNDDTTSSTDPFLRELLNNTNYHQSYLQSGLVLAGVNLPSNESKDDDGRLTAYEATALNLNGTALVVLSACETGRGYLRNGEGVYGLQRGFLLAGARAVLMSLWKVEDGMTRKLMVEFYRAWLRNNDANAALRKAVQRIRATQPWLSPADWGAFVVVE